mgnify:CR=1 FL=1
MIDLLLPRAPLGLLPVVLFLSALVYLDSYKLVRRRAVLTVLCIGGVGAGAGYWINVAILGRFDIELITFSRYLAPVIEEILKGLIVVALIRFHRVGFPVDAAIFGFAAGTGFAIVENIYYLSVLADAHIAVWIVRGLGTAIMHGGATAIFAIIAHTLTEQRGAIGLKTLAPGFAIAILIHSAFNHFLFAPVLSTIGILVALPPLIIYVFNRSEDSLRQWMAIDFDADAELLRLINSGEFSESKLGSYLTMLRERFRPEVIADLLCYVRLHVELSMRANALLMLRESGLDAPVDPDVKSMLEELEYLENSIGKTGQLAIKPFLRMSSRDLWQIYILRKEQ